MHEFSIASSIINEVEKICVKNNIKHVTKVVAAGGVYSCLNDEDLKFAFGSLSRGTKCENAVFDVECPSEMTNDYEIIIKHIEGE